MDALLEKISRLEKRQDTLEKLINPGQTKITDLPKEPKIESIDRKLFLEYVASTENELKQVKIKLATVMERTDGLLDKIKSIKELKTELKAFLSRRGYSKLLGTSSLFKKLFWLVCMVTLFAVSMNFVYKNTKDFNEHGVVTEINNKYNDTIVFPAVTFCLQSLVFVNGSYLLTSLDLRDVFTAYVYESEVYANSSNHFEYFQVYHPPLNISLNCYKFNGERYTADNQETELLQSKQFGASSGLQMDFYLSNMQQFIFYFVGDNKVRPLYTELSHIVQPGEFIYVEIKKLVDKKLAYPYSDCQDNIHPETSRLVKQILAQNITYRQKNCYDLCLLEYISARNYSMLSVFSLNFNYPGNCSHLCPLECETVTFETDVNTFETDALNNTISINFFYSDNKYTEIVQSEKTSGADLIANTGGVLSLFLEFSFWSVYRFILGLVEVFFRLC